MCRGVFEEEEKTEDIVAVRGVENWKLLRTREVMLGLGRGKDLVEIVS